MGKNNTAVRETSGATTETPTTNSNRDNAQPPASEQPPGTTDQSERDARVTQNNANVKMVRETQEAPPTTATQNTVALALLPDLQIDGSDLKTAPIIQLEDDKGSKRVLKDGRVIYYDETGLPVALEKDGKRWEFKYEGNYLVRYQGKDSYLEYQKNGWNRCTADGCRKIDGFKFKSEEGEETVVIGAVTKDMLRDESVIKYADLPEIAETSKSMVDLIRTGGAEGAVKYFAGILPTLDTEQLQQLDRQYSDLTGKSLTAEIAALKASGSLSPATADVLTGLLSTGKDKRSAEQSAHLALTALSEPNSRVGLMLLNATIGGTDESSKQARAAFIAAGGEDRIKSAYTDDESAQRKALDIMDNGSIDPTSLVRENLTNWTWAVGLNAKNIDDIIESMTPEQRKDYLEGERLTKIYGPFSAEQERQMAFYNKLHAALAEASGRTGTMLLRWQDDDIQARRKLIAWEGMIRNGGKKDLAAMITERQDDLGGVNNVLNNMSREDWERLRSDKQYLKHIEDAIRATFSNPNKAAGLGALNHLYRMLGKSSFDDASKVSAGRFFDEFGFVYREPKQVVRLLASGDSSFQQRIKTDATFRSEVIAAIARRTPEGSAERELAIDSVNAIVEDRVGSKFTQLKRNILTSVMNGDKPLAVASQVSSMVKNNPDLKQHLAANPEQAQQLAGFLAKSLKGNQEYASRLLSGQGLTVAEVKNLATSQQTVVQEPYGARSARVVTVNVLSKQEAVDGLTVLTDESRSQDSIDALSTMSAEEKKVADAVKRQGTVQPEDAVRMFVLNIGRSREQLEALFNGMSDIDKQKAVENYKAKYGGNLRQDAGAKVTDAGERVALDNALQVRPTTQIGALSRGLEQKANAENVSSFGRYFTETIAGNVYSVADKRASDATTAVRELAERREKLSEPDKQRLDEALRNVQEASADIREGKKEAVAKLEKAVLTVSAILAIPATAGYGGIALIVGSAALAGITEATLRYQIKGSDYNRNDVMRDALIISSAVLLDGAPFIAQAVAKHVTKTSVALLRDAKTAGEMQTELMKTVKLAAHDQKAAEDALRAIAKKYAAPGKQDQLLVQLENGFEKSAKELRTTNKSVLNLNDAPQSKTVVSANKPAVKPTTTETTPASTVSRTAGQETVVPQTFGKGSTVRVIGEDNVSTIAAFDNVTGKPIVKPKQLPDDAPTAELFKVPQSKMQEEGYRQVTGTDLYIKDGNVYRGRVVEGDVFLAKSDARLVDRNMIVPENAATSVVQRTAGSTTEPGMALPLSGEDQYRLMQYLKRADRHGMRSLNMAEANEFSALLKRVQPGDALYPDAMKAISIENSEALLQRTAIKYTSNMPKPGDMSDFVTIAQNQPRDFYTLKPGAEKLPTFNWATSVGKVTESSRVYKMKNGIEIVVPERLAKRLDEVRELRKLAEADVGYNPIAYARKLRAEMKLASHPYRDHPLPEEIARMVAETPNPGRVKVVNVSGQPYPEDVYRAANGKPMGVAGAQDSSDDSILLYPATSGEKITEDGIYNIFVTSNHEWAHAAQKNEFFKAYTIANQAEKLPDWVRPYARENVNEDWAVVFGELLLAGDPSKLRALAEEAPLRAIALSNTLKSELTIAANSSPYAKQLLDRIKYVESFAMPRAQKTLQEMIRSGDPGKAWGGAMNYLEAIKNADPSLLPMLADYEGLIKLARTTDDDAQFEFLLPFLSPYLKNRPALYHDILITAANKQLAPFTVAQEFVKLNFVSARVKYMEIFVKQGISEEFLPISINEAAKGLLPAEKDYLLNETLKMLDSDGQRQFLESFSRWNISDKHLATAAQRKLAALKPGQR